MLPTDEEGRHDHGIGAILNRQDRVWLVLLLVRGRWETGDSCTYTQIDSTRKNLLVHFRSKFERKNPRLDFISSLEICQEVSISGWLTGLLFFKTWIICVFHFVDTSIKMHKLGQRWIREEGGSSSYLLFQFSFFISSPKVMLGVFAREQRKLATNQPCRILSVILK